MAQDIHQILDAIKALIDKSSQNEAEAILIALEKGRLFQELKKVARGRWLKKLMDLGIDERIARRHLTLAEHWTPDRTPGPDLLAKLPHDLQKLEWMCRLSLEQLEMFCQVRDCRKESRGQIIAAVKRMLNLTDTEEEERKLTPASIRKQLDSSLKRLRDGLEELEDADRHQLIPWLEERLELLKKELHSAEDGPSLDEGEEPEEPAAEDKDADSEAGEGGEEPAEPGAAEGNPNEAETVRKASDLTVDGFDDREKETPAGNRRPGAGAARRPRATTAK